MSRTYKDKPDKVSRKENDTAWDKDIIRIPYTCEYISYNGEFNSYSTYHSMQLPTTKTKKRKEVDTEDHWMTTPGWWIRLVMNKPQRRAQHLQEKAALKAADIEDVDFPNLGRKPHVYYW